MNILIVGLGSIALKHINAIKSIEPAAQFFALRSAKPASEVAGIQNLYALSELAEISFDFAVISNPTALHRQTIKQLLPLKIPLFIEKPLSNTLEISELLNEISNLGIYTYIACNLRFYDSLNYIKNFMVNKPRINEISVYCGSFLPDWRPNTNFRTGYSALPELGGGVHLDLIHEIDYIYWFFGKPISIQKTFKSKSSLQIEAIDYAHYLLDYNDFCVNITLNYFRRDYKRQMEIVFENETWLVDLAKNCITTSNQIIFASEQSILDTYKTQMEHFIQNKNTVTQFNSIHEAFEVLKICL